MVDHGFEVHKDEKGEVVNMREIMNNKNEYKRLMLRKSHLKFTSLLNTIQTTNHMIRLSLKQWSMYMTDCEKWMCHFINESALPYSFRDLNPLGEDLIRNSLSGV